VRKAARLDHFGRDLPSAALLKRHSGASWGSGDKEQSAEHVFSILSIRLETRLAIVFLLLLELRNY
jgi:hypothetical protein